MNMKRYDILYFILFSLYMMGRLEFDVQVETEASA